MAAVGAFYLLAQAHEEYGRTFVRVGVIAGAIASILMIFPTGDGQGKNIAFHQPATLAAMEGLFEHRAGRAAGDSRPARHGEAAARQSADRAERAQLSDLPALESRGPGLNAFPRDTWPDNIPLLYYSYHIMVGLGTIFIAVMALAALELWRGGLYQARGCSGS